MTISRRAFLRGFSATAGIAALAGCDLLGQLDPADGEGIGIIAPARITDQPDPNSTPTVEPDTWHMGAPMPTPRIGVAGAAAHGRIYVMGGWLYGGGASNDNEAYDPSTDRWQEVAPLPQATRRRRGRRRRRRDIPLRRFQANSSPIGRCLAIRSLY